MNNKLNQLTILFTLFISSLSIANPINKINFIGLDFTAESTLNQLIPFKAGQTFSPSASDEIIKSLFDTGLFSDVQIIQNKNILNIKLLENPYIKYLTIDNNPKKWFSFETDLFNSEDLEEFSKSYDMSTGNVFTEEKLTNFISFLDQKYVDAGFYNIEISSNSKIDVQNRIGVEIEIKQNVRATIESLKISGAKSFTEKKLLSFFPIGEPGFKVVNYFTNKDQFTSPSFQFGLDAITNNYFNAGYLDFNILEINTTLSENNEKIDIEIEIYEGNQFKLGKVSFTGELGNKSPGELTALLPISKGDTFNRSLIMEGIQLINDAFSDQGYAFAEIEPITYDSLNEINVDINISLNKKVYINRITISGNTRTQDEVIRREIGIFEGGLYSRSVLRNSVMKLRRLGYFSDVQMMASDVIGSNDKINLNFTVDETKTGAISFSLSHSNNYGIAIGAGIQEKNIFGSGNTFNSELKLSDSYNKVSFYFEDPYFNDQGHSISYGAFFSEIKDDDVMKDSYEISTKGLNIGYGVPLTENTRIRANLEYSQNDINCGVSFSSSSYESSQCSNKSQDETKLSVGWSESTLNDYMYPTNGRENSIKLGMALPVSDYRYIDINAKHKSYKPINENLTLKVTGSLDFLKGYDGKEAPFYKRYFGGGTGSVRGFGNKSLGPLYLNGNAKGGELSILGSANLISPAFFFDDNEKMRMSAFIDSGNIFEKASNIDLGDLRMSTGFGFAYLSPIGAIGAYWSTPILKKSGDVIENFGFSLGTGF